MNFQERRRQREKKTHINKHITMVIRSKPRSLIILHSVSTNTPEIRSEERRNRRTARTAGLLSPGSWARMSSSNRPQPTRPRLHAAMFIFTESETSKRLCGIRRGGRKKMRETPGKENIRVRTGWFPEKATRVKMHVGLKQEVTFK